MWWEGGLVLCPWWALVSPRTCSGGGCCVLGGEAGLPHCRDGSVRRRRGERRHVQESRSSVVGGSQGGAPRLRRATPETGLAPRVSVLVWLGHHLSHGLLGPGLRAGLLGEKGSRSSTC